MQIRRLKMEASFSEAAIQIAKIQNHQQKKIRAKASSQNSVGKSSVHKDGGQAHKPLSKYTVSGAQVRSKMGVKTDKGRKYKCFQNKTINDKMSKNP